MLHQQLLEHLPAPPPPVLDVGGGASHQRFAAVLCHGVLGYLERPEPLVDHLCRCAAAGGVVSIMVANAKVMAVRPALERGWDDALASFDAGRD